MTACPRCGTANPDRARFCVGCGLALATSDDARLPERRRLVTILFADAVGSTELAERIDPEALRALMDSYFGTMRRHIEAHDGTVEKFVGDAVMAVFGNPVVHEDDALRAVRAAAAIRAELDDSDRLRPEGRTIRFRMGIQTGEVFAKDPAAGQTFVTGDAVNVAARLEGAASPGEILLGDATYRLVRAAVTAEAVAPVAAKGKSAPLRAYRLLTVDRGQARPAPPFEVPFVGRADESGRIAEAYRRAVDEVSCQLVTVLGPAGIGKSRLVGEFTATHGADATVVRGRCLSYGEGITYWPIAEIVRAVATIDDADDAAAARAKLRAVVRGEPDADMVEARVASAVGMSLDPTPQEEVFWAIRKLFEHLARSRPMVIVVEDIHWAESTLLDLIEHVVERSRDAPILLLCPTRPELLDDRPEWGAARPRSETVHLEPLGDEATTRLIAELPGGTALPADLSARVLTAAEGNPLFIEEMLRMLVDDGTLIEEGGVWRAAATLEEVRVPPSIGALLSARLERLTPDERSVAELGSIVGRVFEREAVTVLASPTLRPNVGHALRALVRKELIQRGASELGTGPAFKFRHVLIRDAAYAEMPKADRARLHQIFADWLESTVGARLTEFEEIVGYHLERALRLRIDLGESRSSLAALAGRAGTHLAAAGGRAFDRGDMAATEILLARAAEALPVGSPLRLDSVLDHAFALLSIGRPTDADALLEAAAVEATVAGEPVLAIRADLERALIAFLTDGRAAPALETARSALPDLERERDDRGLARAHLVIATASWAAGRVESAVASRDIALVHARRAGDLRTERRIAFWGADFYGTSPAEAAISHREAMLARSQLDPMRRAEALFSLGPLYALRGRAEEARAASRDVTAILTDLGSRFWAAGSYEVGVLVELILGDAERAEAWVGEGIVQLERVGATGYLASILGLQSIALARQGKADAAIRAADRALSDASPGDPLTRVHAQVGRSAALRGLGDLRGAVDAARDAVETAEPTDWLVYRAAALLELAEVSGESGDRRGAIAAATRARDLSVAKQDEMDRSRAELLLGRLDGA